MSSKVSARIRSLDGIRAFAVAWVFLTHAYGKHFPGGFLGVDVFFVLSGFVITRNLLEHGVDFRRFYLHRATRILPPVVPVLLFAAWTLAAGYSATSYFNIAAAAASIINWTRALGIADAGMLGHFWSLAVEEQFYLIWPLALTMIVRSGMPLTLTLMLVIASSVSLQVAIYMTTEDFSRVYNGLDTRASQLAMGCLLAAIKPVDLGRFWAIPVAFFAVALFVVSQKSEFYLTVGIPLAGLAAMLLIAISAWSTTPLNRVLENRIVQWAGSRSYAIYLWHYPLIMMAFTIGHELALPAYVAVASAFAFTCVAAELSMQFVEKPARRLRDSLERGEIGGGGPKPLGTA